MLAHFEQLLDQNMLLCDTGTKNVAKRFRKIAKGRMKDCNLTWFPELVDKRM